MTARALLEAADEDVLHRMNNDLCDFAMRWDVDGDYMRCSTCQRPQLASYAGNEFQHAPDCTAQSSEPRPWETFIGLLRPIASSLAEQPAKGEGCKHEWLVDPDMGEGSGYVYCPICDVTRKTSDATPQPSGPEDAVIARMKQREHDMALTIGDAARVAYLEHGKDSWLTIGRAIVERLNDRESVWNVALHEMQETLLGTPPTAQRHDEGKPASPNDDRDVSAVIRHGLFFYEVDFGDEGKGCYVRLYDFNRVVEKLERAAHGAGAAVEAVDDDDAYHNAVMDFEQSQLEGDLPSQQRSEQDVEETARRLLAEAYEELIGEGPYPTYANLARHGKGAFTLCSIRAIKRALCTQPLLSDQPAGVSEEMIDRALKAYGRVGVDGPVDSSTYARHIGKLTAALEAALHPDQAKDGAAG